MNYRSEIDGLRSVAVVGVIVFHLENPWLQGGFLGVDVFFTISGYLICSIIIQQLDQGSFSLWRFWKRRVLRLFPALAFMVACVLLAGGFLQIQPERSDMPLQALASLLSFANILFWKTTGGYWTAPSESIPLLHTWSLSLEEQFYICLPLFLIVTRHLRPRALAAFLFLIFLFSLSLSIFTTPSFRSASFYMLPTRMWELLLGALLSIWHFRGPKIGRLLSMIRFQKEMGLILIIASYFLIENDEGFPGWQPLIPCVGTLLILNSNGSLISPASRWLQHPLFVNLGKLSYSLYLWHWPVIVLLPYLGITSHTLTVTSFLGLAIFSYFLIEKPIRYGASRPGIRFGAVAALTLLGFLFLLLFPKSPLLSDLANLDSSDSLTRGGEFEALEKLRANNAGLFFDNPDATKAIWIVGSSHVRVMGEPIRNYAENNGFDFMSLATSSLGVTSRPHEEAWDAEEINQLRLNLIKWQKPDVVIVAGMWSTEANREDFSIVLEKRLLTMAESSGLVVVVAQVPMVIVPKEFNNDLRKFLVSRRLTGSYSTPVADPSVGKANEIVQGIVDRISRDDVVFVDASKHLQSNNEVRLVAEELFLYSDYHHVNDDGAKIAFDGAIREVLDNYKQNDKITNKF